MVTVVVDDVELYVEDLGGDGPLCLMLHGGLGMDHTYYRPHFDRLRSLVRVVYYDMRANGRSGDGPEASLRIDRWADDAAALAEVLGADRFFAIGHSYGGFVGQELVLRHPERLLGLGLLCTTPGGVGTTEPAGAPQGAPPPPELIELMGSPVSSNEEMAAMMGRLLPFYLHQVDPSVLAARMADTIFRYDTMIRSTQQLASWSTYDRLSSVRCPTLVMGARHDSFCAPEQSDRIASQVPAAELEIFEHSGHFPWLEESERFWLRLEGWLAAHV